MSFHELPIDIQMILLWGATVTAIMFLVVVLSGGFRGPKE